MEKLKITVGVLGCSGFLGRNIIEALRKDFHVVGFLRNKGVEKNGQIIYSADLTEFLERCDIIFNCVGRAYKGYVDPDYLIFENDLFRSLRKIKKKLLFIDLNSLSYFGYAGDLLRYSSGLVTEDTEPRRLSEYGSLNHSFLKRLIELSETSPFVSYSALFLGSVLPDGMDKNIGVLKLMAMFPLIVVLPAAFNSSQGPPIVKLKTLCAVSVIIAKNPEKFRQQFFIVCNDISYKTLAREMVPKKVTVLLKLPHLFFWLINFGCSLSFAGKVIEISGLVRYSNRKLTDTLAQCGVKKLPW